MEQINWFEKAALIPALPKVALDLIETFKQDEPDPRRLARDIEADAVLSARLLRLANSPYYAARKPIKTIQDALMMLGFSPVRNLALSAAVSSLGKSANGMDMAIFGSLTLLSGMCSEALAGQSGLNKGEAFAAGLLRPIGMLLMRAAQPNKMAEIDAIRSMLDPRRADEERRVFGIDHGELSGQLATRWKLPAEIASALSGDGKTNSAVKLAQWAAARAMSDESEHALFDAFAPAQEWFYDLELDGAPGQWTWPTLEALKERFGSLVG